MKNITALLAFALVAMGSSSAFATSTSSHALVKNLRLADMVARSVQPLYVINWKVGDTATYDITAAFGSLGTSVKKVTKDEGDSLWVNQTMSMMGQNQVVDMQLDKNTGKVLKIIQNGQEQQIPDDKLDIISQDYTTITVKAGTFKCIHIVAKSAQVSHMEVWANPQATVMDGAIKETMSTGMMDITLELTSFTHGQ